MAQLQQQKTREVAHEMTLRLAFAINQTLHVVPIEREEFQWLSSLMRDAGISGPSGK